MELKNKEKVGFDYLVVVRGAVPVDVSERISRIHSEAILKMKKAIVIK